MAAQFHQRYIALNVKCVATGVRHDAKSRAVCSVAVIDYGEKILLQKAVKPEAPIVSYLTPLSGVREGDLDGAESTEVVIAQVKALLGPDVILVGQGLVNDIEWLCLEEGRDYGGIEELAEMFKRYSSFYGSYTFYSLRHEANTLLSEGNIDCNAKLLHLNIFI